MSSLPRFDDDTPTFTRPITTPVLIRGSWFDVGCLPVAIVIGAGAVVNGVKIAGIPPWHLNEGIIWWVVGGLFWLYALATAVWRLPRRWIEVTLTGFVITQFRRTKAYADEAVVGLSRGYSHGASHRVELEVRGPVGVERIVCTYADRSGEEDPLAGLWERFIHSIARWLRDGLDKGAHLEGKRWRLDANGLRHRRRVVPLGQISRVGIFGQELCVWQGDDERPFARIPQASRNALPLGVFLRERVQQRADLMEPPPGLPLGRVLYEYRLPDAAVGAFAIVLGLAVFACLFPNARVAVPSFTWRIYLFPIGHLVLSLALGGVLIWRARSKRLAFHERGVVWHGHGGVTRSLRYSEIGTVVCKQGPTIVLSPVEGLDRSTIRLRSWMSLGAEPALLLETIDRLCLAVALRWRMELLGGPMKWTSRLRFLPGGLEYRTKDWLGDGETVTVPYHLTTYEIGNGIFRLFTPEQKGPVFTASVGEINFFPGLLLLAMMRAEGRTNAGGVGEPAPRPTSHEAPDERFRGDGGFRS